MKHTSKRIPAAVLAAMLLMLCLTLSACSTGGNTNPSTITPTSGPALVDTPTTQPPTENQAPAVDMAGKWDATEAKGISHIIFLEDGTYSLAYHAQNGTITDYEGTYTAAGKMVTLKGDISAAGTLDDTGELLDFTFNTDWYNDSVTFKKMPNL